MLDAAAKQLDDDHTTGHTHQLISSKRVRALFDDVSEMTLWRWQNDPDLGFPKPIFVHRRKYWRESEIIDFIESRPLELSTPPVGNRHQQRTE